MKNILFIVPSLRKAGAETQVIDLVNSMDNRKYSIHLLSFSEVIEQYARIDQSKVKFHHVHTEVKI